MAAFKIFFAKQPKELEDMLNVFHAKNVTIESWKISAEPLGEGLWVVVEYTDNNFASSSSKARSGF